MSHHDQLFNVNRFSRHYARKEMNADQVEAMYRKLTEKTGVRMTPHRFRHTLASDLMKQHERNIHVAKDLPTTQHPNNNELYRDGSRSDSGSA